MTIYRPAQNLSVGGDLTRNSDLGAEIPGFHLRQKFWPGGRNSVLGVEILAPRKFSFLKIPAKNSGPLLKVAPQLERKDLAKIRRAGNSRIFGTRKFWLLRISSPFLQAAPQPFVKDLAEFLRARNYEISGRFTECSTTTFCKGLSRIEFPAPRNFVQGRKFPALKHNFRPYEIQSSM
jgi:hypothetical protein